MILTALRLLSGILTAFRLRSELALENPALRQQLAVFLRQQPRPRIRKSDRVFWRLLSRFWGNWKETLVIVRPAKGGTKLRNSPNGLATVLAKHRSKTRRMLPRRYPKAKILIFSFFERLQVVNFIGEPSRNRIWNLLIERHNLWVSQPPQIVQLIEPLENPISQIGRFCV